MYLIVFIPIIIANGWMTGAYNEYDGNGIYGIVNGAEDFLSNDGQKLTTNLGFVDISRFIDKSRPNKRYYVNVDDTMTRLKFQVTVEGSFPLIDVIDPEGNIRNIQPVNEIGDMYNISTYDIVINSTTDYGRWAFKNTIGSIPWNVTVQGVSSVSIYHELYEVGSNITLDHSPYADTDYRLVVTVTGMASIQTVDPIFIMYSEERMQLVKQVKTNTTGVNTFETQETGVLFEPFYLKVEGKDYSNNTIQRIDPQLIHPIRVSIDVLDYAGVELQEHEELNVTITVTCHHTSASYIEVKIEDTANFTKEPKAFNYSLSTGVNSSDIITMQLGDFGSSTVMRISSKFKGPQQNSLNDGPEVVRTFTVKSVDASSAVGAIIGGVFGAGAVTTAGGVGGYFLAKMMKNRKFKVQSNDNKEDKRQGLEETAPGTA